MRVESSAIALTKTLSLVGRSRAGDGTCFVVPELGLMLDCGAPVSGKPVSHLFLTHCHHDHTSFLAPTLHQKQQQRASPSGVRVYLPAVVRPTVESFLQTWKTLNDGNDLQAQAAPFHYELVGVEPGQEFEIITTGSRHQPVLVQILECDHRVTCYGYSFRQRRRHLKAEYRPSPDDAPSTAPLRVRDLEQQGIDPFEVVTEPLFTFLGDTTHAVFERHPEILQTSAVIVVECSFLLDSDVKRARETTHMHWNHLRPHVEANPDTLFVLTHFSLRYKGSAILQFFQTYRNVHPMLTLSETQERRQPNDGADPEPEPEPVGCACFRCRPETMASS